MSEIVGVRPPTPLEAYQAGLYHFDLVEPLPEPIRIPVQGPAPFNMLAIVQTLVSITRYTFNGPFERLTIDVPTTLVVAGVDPLAPQLHPQKHSSAGTLRRMQTTNDTDFVIAIDRIRPESRFDARGRWWLTVDVANQFDSDIFSEAQAHITSWVLYLDPTPVVAPGTAVPAKPPGVAPTMSGVAGQTHQLLAVYQTYLSLPGADTFAAAQEIANLLRQVAGHADASVEAADGQQLVVEALDATSPNDQDPNEIVALRAEARQNLILRLLEAGRPADAAAAVAPMLERYRAYVEAGGDRSRVLRELGDPIKPLLGAHLTGEALAITRAQLEFLEHSHPLDPTIELAHRLDLANARHNLVARLLDAGQRDEAAAVAAVVVGEYLDYAARAGADVAEAVAQLRAFQHVVDGGGLTEASASTSAAINSLT